MTNLESDNKPNQSYTRIAVEGVLRFLLLPLITFLAAGRLDYWQGWVFYGLLSLLVVFSLVKFADKPDLVKERMNPGPGIKPWDRVLLVLFVGSFVATLVVAPVDVGRFKWSPELPVFVYVSAYAIMALSSAIIYWATWTNRFFSSVVRIQTDRGQVVIQTGPYRFVRHPGYAAYIPLGLSFPLVLGSLWGLIPAGLSVVLLVIRTYLEDVTLQRELLGYADYARQVRYRLLPGVW